MKTIIVGAGLGGIAAAVELMRHGYTELTLLESAPDLGGTWHYNTYPGAACDVPSHLYSFSYAQRRDWSRMCSPQQEILAYIREVAAEHDVAAKVVTGTTVTACTWNETTCRWHVRAENADGNVVGHHADALIMATGQLNQPAIPAFPGADTFAGTAFHSARWDHDFDVRGKRVAVIGSGASAVQIVPAIADQVDKLSVFQRTGNWFMPRRNEPYAAPVRWAMRRSPAIARAWRWLIFQYMETLTASIHHPNTFGLFNRAISYVFMRSQLRDSDIRAKAWPDYSFGCKRILFSSAFLPALQKPNVELVTDAIEQITPAGIRTGDGREHEFDAIVYATGFRTNDFMLPMAVTGVGGRTLARSWADGAHAYLGISVPAFPSMFLMYGPNTNSSGGSVIHFLEAQARFIRTALDHIAARDAVAVDVRAEVESRADYQVQQQFAGTTWTQCNSWYRADNGRIVANWPGYMREYTALTRHIDADDYNLIPGPSTPVGDSITTTTGVDLMAQNSERPTARKRRTAPRPAAATDPNGNGAEDAGTGSAAAHTKTVGVSGEGTSTCG
ncbi:flavin-containing monooxygenase [Nocardia vaccinii]|uniref:flavin-containing monooxygenase n=1 Tax=Nocardia vaccinii TaxID=1822 RepID=UPI00082E9A0C|nr:NAD(P)/FAD-dependent oxidoreductase [Nocardia vaccinii]